MAVKFCTYEGSEYKVAYNLINPDCKKAIVFLHGWGSSKELMQKAFAPYFKEYAHIYIDLPGFGKSNYYTPLTTPIYAKIVQQFLQQFDYEIEAVFGHSFGGKVATLLHPKKLVLLSSAGIVEPKPLKVRCKIALFKLLKPLKIAKIKRFFISSDAKDMDAVMYQTFKNVVDEDFTNRFKNYNNKALVIWGKEDSATSIKSGKKIAALLPNSAFYPLEGDHYFFLHHPKTVEKIYYNNL